MKRLLAALFLVLSPLVALAQPINVITPRTSDYIKIESPRFVYDSFAPISALAALIGNAPCGTNGQIQFNNNGVCGSFTPGGDLALNLGTGAFTINNGAVTGSKLAVGAAVSNVANGTITSTMLASGAAVANLGFTPINVTTRGVANGVPTLDSGGFVPLSQLPPSIAGGLAFQGNWNANTNSPTLVSSTGTVGQYYFVSIAGSTTLNGTSSWAIGDLVLFSSGVWNKIPGPGGGSGITSVAGLTGPTISTPSLLSALSIPAGANGSVQLNVGGTLTGVTMSGDATISTAGALTIANAAVTGAKIATNVALNGIPTAQAVALSTDPASALQAATKQYVDKLGFVTPQQVDSLCGTAGHDCTTVLQTLVNGSVEVRLPCGQYYVTALTITGAAKRLNGAGDCSQIWASASATNDIVQIGDGNPAHTGNVQVSNILIWSNVTKSAGCALNISAAARTHLDHVHIGNFDTQANFGNQLSTGLCVTNSAVSFARSLMVMGATFTGVSITDTILFEIDAASWISSCANAGVVITGTGGGGGSSVNLDNQIFACGGYGILVTGAQNKQLFLGPWLAADSTGNDVLHVDANAFGIGDAQLLCTGCWLTGSTGGNCVALNATAPGTVRLVARFVGAHISFCSHGTGVFSQLSGNSTLQVQDSDLVGNGTAGSGGQGVWFANNPTTVANIITGNTIMNNGIVSNGWGIVVTGTAIPQAIMADNVITGNAQGAIAGLAASATIKCGNNITTGSTSC